MKSLLLTFLALPLWVSAASYPPQVISLGGTINLQTNGFTAIQVSNALVSAAASPSGTIVTLGIGVFSISNLVIGSGVTIKGQGMGLTILDVGVNNVGFIPTNNLTVQDLSIKTTAGASANRFPWASSVSVSNFTLLRVEERCSSDWGSLSAATNWARFDSCRFTGSWDGLLISGNDDGTVARGLIEIINPVMDMAPDAALNPAGGLQAIQTLERTIVTGGRITISGGTHAGSTGYGRAFDIGGAANVTICGTLINVTGGDNPTAIVNENDQGISTISMCDPPSVGLLTSGPITYPPGILATNLSTAAPDFNLPCSLFSTNNTFQFLACKSVDLGKTAYQYGTVFITNTTALVKTIIPPTNSRTNGINNVTNLTRVDFEQYAQKFTNFYFMPLY